MGKFGFTSVSYTHLDVYKRQTSTNANVKLVLSTLGLIKITKNRILLKTLIITEKGCRKEVKTMCALLCVCAYTYFIAELSFLILSSFQR